MRNHLPTVVRKLALKPGYNAEPIMCMVEIDIDIEGIAQFAGTKALRNKSKRSKYGYITVTVRPCQT